MPQCTRIAGIALSILKNTIRGEVELEHMQIFIQMKNYVNNSVSRITFIMPKIEHVTLSKKVFGIMS